MRYSHPKDMERRRRVLDWMEKREVSAQEISEALGEPRTTLYQLLHYMVAEGLIEHRKEGRGVLWQATGNDLHTGQPICLLAQVWQPGERV